MKYGYFDERNKEYVITRPDTPTSWMNYLGLDEYCAMISNSESSPLAVEKGRSFNSPALGGNPIGSQSFELALKPRQKISLVFVLGVEQDKASARKKVVKFSNLKLALQELDRIKLDWQDYLQSFSLARPIGSNILPVFKDNKIHRVENS